MSLLGAIRQAAASGLAALGDLRTTCTYTHVDGTPTYDPTTGSVTATPTEKPNVTVVLSDEQRMKRTEFGMFRMTVAYIHSSELDIDPRDGDYLTAADGRRWNVAGILANNGVVWELEVQENI